MVRRGGTSRFFFPFGYGLSYTTYQYSGSKGREAGKEPTVNFTVKYTGARAGAEIAEVYVALPAAADEPPKRLASWSKVQLNPGESKPISLKINPRELSIYDDATNGWKQLSGTYTFMVGGSSKDLPLHQEVQKVHQRQPQVPRLLLSLGPELSSFNRFFVIVVTCLQHRRREFVASLAATAALTQVPSVACVFQLSTSSSPLSMTS